MLQSRVDGLQKRHDAETDQAKKAALLAQLTAQKDAVSRTAAMLKKSQQNLSVIEEAAKVDAARQKERATETQNAEGKREQERNNEKKATLETKITDIKAKLAATKSATNKAKYEEEFQKLTKEKNGIEKANERIQAVINKNNAAEKKAGDEKFAKDKEEVAKLEKSITDANKEYKTLEKNFFKLEDAAFKVEAAVANPAAPTDAEKKAIADAWALFDAENLKYMAKKTEIDNFTAQKGEMQGRIDARGGDDKRASDEAAAAQKVKNLESSFAAKEKAFTDTKKELDAIQDKNSDAYKKKQKALAAAERAFKENENTMNQLKAEAERSKSEQVRQDERDLIIRERSEINVERDFFNNQIKYAQDKIDYLDLIQGALDMSTVQADGKFVDEDFFESLRQEKEKTFRGLDLLNSQFIEVDTRAQDIDFEEFSMKQRHEKADEAAFKQDQDRKKWLKDEMTKEKTDLEKFNKEIKDAEDALTGDNKLSAEQLAERQANNARLAEINQTLGGIDAEIAAFATKQADAQKKRDEDEKKRKEKEATE